MKDLIPLYKQMAATGVQFRGLSILQHKDQIRDLVRKHQAKTLLDYGCGAGDAYRSPNKVHREWGLQWFNVTLYDPAFREHDERPFGKFGGVLCSDVLEHIREDEVPAFIARLFSHAERFVWASVCCRPAKKTFPDTEINLHVTLQPMDWWREQFARAATPGVEWVLVETP